MHKLMLTTFLVAGAMPAFAADMPVKAPRVEAVPYTDWSGIYVGIQGGYGWGRQKWDGSSVFEGGDIDISQVRTPATGFPALLFTNRVFLPDFDIPGTSSLKNRGWVFGGHAGAQKQWGNWVIGLEADFDAADIKGSSSATDEFRTNLDTQIRTRILLTPTISLPPGSFPGTIVDIRPGVTGALVTQTSTVETKLDQLGTLRGKIGLTNIFSPNIMLYGTGGMAWAHSETTLTAEQTVSGTMNPAIVRVGTDGAAIGTRAFTDTSTLEAKSAGYIFGWTAGAGIDWKLTPNVVLGALYLHYDFPKNTLAFTESGVRMGNARQEVDVIKGRLSVLFPIH